jgi:hypothetical protein
MSHAGSQARRDRTLDLAVLAGFALLAALCLALFRTMKLDDAFITYNYARNLARSGELLYHPGNPYLSTSAPLYAVLLGLPAALGADIPALSNVLSAIGVFGASASVYLLFRRRGARAGGVVAGLLIVTSPLLWLSLGLETCWLVFLVCAAFCAADADKPALTGALLGLAVLTRNDALIAAAIVAAQYLFLLRRPIPWKAAAVFLAVVLPFFAYLTLGFGSPVPATLEAKQAQARLGISGFYVDTAFLEGLAIMGRGWWSQSRLYLLLLPVMALGAAALVKARWAWGIVAWGALHLLAYVVLGVTPYFWYYAPAMVSVAVLAGLGIQWVGERSTQRWAPAFAALAAALLVMAHLASLREISAGLTGPLPPNTDPISKALPGSNGEVYRRTGEWLNANTPAEATVGVTEVGVMGYFADRPMVDFLGVLWPDVARALQRGDLYYTIPHHMPDYLVLDADLGTFGLPLATDEWLLGNYRPVETIEDPLGRHAPMVVLRRGADPAALVEHGAEIEIGEAAAVDGYAVEEARLAPGQPVRVRVDLSKKADAPQDVKTIAYFNAPDGSLAFWAERDSNTADWPDGETFPLYHVMRAPDDLAPGAYQFGIRVIAGGGAVDAAHHLVTYEIGAAP